MTINLSILDFKTIAVLVLREYLRTINLSILDFKSTRLKNGLYFFEVYKSIHTGF